MNKLNGWRFLLAAATTLSLAACAPGQSVLPDDPENEPTNGSLEQPAPSVPQADEPTPAAGDSTSILAKYDHLDPNRQVPTDLLKKAVLYYDQNYSKIANKTYLSVIDFKKKSSLPRFFIINMNTGAVWAIRTAHGKNSDLNHDGYADSFSNTSGSNQSSLGIYRAAETYSGSHGLSLRLDGLSSTNSNARARAIVIHGADYVQESNVIQGRSWGCPAVSMGNRTEVINRLKGGSIIYAGLSGQ